MSDKVVMIIRILFGVFLLTFGLNKFLNFMPFPPIPGDGGTLMGIYISSGFMSIIGVLEMLIGASMVLKKYVPLALTFGIAILLNATLFHAFHNIENIAGALFGLVLALVLVYAHRGRFKDLLSA